MSIDFRSTLYWGFPLENTKRPAWAKKKSIDPLSQWEDYYTMVGLRVPAQRKQWPCIIGCSQQYEQPNYYVAVQASCQSGDYNSPASVVEMAIAPDWQQQLRGFCQIMQLPWNEPQWYLTSVMF